jgi:uncharacterized protein
MKVLAPDGAEGGADPILDLLKTYKTIGGRIVIQSGAAELWRDGIHHEERGLPDYSGESKRAGSAGGKSYARLEDVPETIGIVNIFRRVEEVAPMVENEIRIGAKVVWMQLDIEHEPAAEKARAAGLTVVEDACILIEHRKRLRQLNS